MTPGWVSRHVSIWAMWLLGAAAALAAASAGAQQANVDPPGRVARLSYVEGDVSLAPQDSEEWADAVLNRPLTSGDRLSIDGGRAELQIGSSTIRLDEKTRFSFIQLDDDVVQMSLTEGAASIHVRSLGERETIQVQTPNGTVRLLHPGEYLVQVDPTRDETIVKARSGEAEVAGGSQTYRVRANEEGAFTGLQDMQASIHAIARRTDFEAWANEREGDRERSQSARYVSNEVIGYEDLDDNGEWYHEPAYGYVWRPLHVAYDWAPYRYGRWAWIRPWGWTWVDDARWGFAPFHYGRWAYVSQRWCWVPGPRYVRPVYAPALVGWIGGPSVSISFSFGSGVGWFPLAPHEVYVPGYWHTPRYIRSVNVANTVIYNQTNITNMYAGRQYPRGYRNGSLADAITLARREAFVSGRSLGGQRIRLNDRDVREWRHDARPPAIAPNRSSILAGEPRLVRHDGRTVVTGRNPKDRGDFRVSRQVDVNALDAASGQRGGSRPIVDRGVRGVNAGPIKSDAQRARPESRVDDSARGNDSARRRTDALRGDDSQRRDYWQRPDTRAPRSSGATREQYMPRQPSYRSEPRQAAPVMREARPPSQSQSRGQVERNPGSAVRQSDSGSGRQNGNSGGGRGNSGSRGDSRGGSRTQQP